MTSEIALRYGVHRNQLYGWRRELRAAAAAETGAVGSDFVPIIAENRAGLGAALIEIEIAGALVRVGLGVDLGVLGEVIALLRATA